MRTAICLGICFASLLQGCAMSGTIRHDAVAHETAIADLTDKFLVENILQARDKAPLHFVNIPLIHESIQTGATLSAAVPFAARHGSTTRASAAAGASIQVSPSFDIALLNSKDFVTGIASPIDPKFLKYWLDRGLDRRIVLLLFIGEVDITESSSGMTARIKNSPRDSIEAVLQDERDALNQKAPDRCGSSDFSRYLTIVNKLRESLTANLYRERTQVGEDFDIDMKAQFKDLAGLDPTKFVVERTPRGRHRLYSLSQGFSLALCYGEKDQPGQVSLNGARAPSANACSSKTVSIDIGAPAGNAAASLPLFRTSANGDQYCAVYERFLKNPSDRNLKLSFSVRSVGEMVQFLGDLVAYQERLEQARKFELGGRLQRHNSPVTIDYCYTGEPCLSRGPAGVLLDVHADPATARFEVDYRGETLWVGPYSQADHSLEVLSVVQQLIDLNRSASDVRPTPIVQVVP